MLDVERASRGATCRCSKPRVLVSGQDPGRFNDRLKITLRIKRFYNYFIHRDVECPMSRLVQTAVMMCYMAPMPIQPDDNEQTEDDVDDSASANDDLRQDPLFPTAITPAEQQAGFVAGSIRTPPGTHQDSPWSPPVPERTAAAVRNLGSGLRAVKTFSPVTKSVQYAIYSAKDRPVQETAMSLHDLLKRFP